MNFLCTLIVTTCIFFVVANAQQMDCYSTGLTVYCDLQFNSNPAAEFTLIWQKTNGNGPVVYKNIKINALYTQVQLFRFAPVSEYLIQCYVKDTIIMDTTVTTGSTGISELDTEPFAYNITGSPSFDILFADIGNAYAAVDTTGFVVWFYDTNGTLPMEPAQAKSQLPNGDFLFLDNGMVIQVAPNGTLVALVILFFCFFLTN